MADPQATTSAALDAALVWAGDAVWIAAEMASAGVRSSSKGSAFDVITPADGAIERYLRDQVASKFPDHEFLGEEEGGASGRQTWQWVVDPIDGTLNYATGLAGATCSIACLHEGQPVVGVIADFTSGVVYGSRAGTGIIVRGDPSGAVQVHPSRTAVGAGRIFLDFGWEGIQGMEVEAIDLLRQRQPRFIRMVGGAAYALLHVALHGGSFLAIGLRIWDVAAGVVLVRESGLEVRTWETDSGLHIVAGGRVDLVDLAPIVQELGGQRVALV
jgi:myo-inositol-1(or 4)-monophosphatase